MDEVGVAVSGGEARPPDWSPTVCHIVLSRLIESVTSFFFYIAQKKRNKCEFPQCGIELCSNQSIIHLCVTACLKIKKKHAECGVG